MNQISTVGNSAGPIGDTMSFLTTIHFAWIVVLAVLVVIGIVYGARLKRQRTIAERQAVVHAREAGVAPAPASDFLDQGGAAGDVPAAPEPTRIAPSPAPIVAAPRPLAEPVPTDAASGSLAQLKGLGPKVATRLGELGVTTVGQVAALDHDHAQALDAQLGPFRGRMERDRWIEQARFLAAGDRAGFEAVFGKL